MYPLMAALVVGIIVFSWIPFAEHPIARNLRTALSDALAL
jgi:hypothetical protein